MLLAIELSFYPRECVCQESLIDCQITRVQMYPVYTKIAPILQRYKWSQQVQCSRASGAAHYK